MSDRPVAVLRTGLVTPVGLTAPASCAAIRAKISNPTETRCVDSADEPIMAHQVLLDRPWRGLAKLAKMAAMAIEDCVASDPTIEWSTLPVLLCTAEQSRPGRVDGINDRLFRFIADELGVKVGPNTSVVSCGRTSIAVALKHARDLIYQDHVERVLIVATDSLVRRQTLEHYEENNRLLTPSNSNGFTAGEGACAFLIGKPTGKRELVCAGLGFAFEPAHIDSGEPLRGDALMHGHRMALADSGRSMDDVDYRITDLSGEHYYFREAALAFSRLARKPTEESELWHPAECVGEGGAALGGVCLAVAHAAAVRGYAPGRTALLHLSDDDGQRASVICVGG